ncbi:hypothetical protein K3495_g15338 [Podosphaera aphanis]|nr:hypothetical protein K3495_g15338 [Podosphaera aphanis]
MLNRLILAKLPRELTNFYPSDMIMKINRPLYGIPEAGTHWWATYSKYHREKLGMNVSSYDPCLFFTNTSDHVGIIGLQTDDTLILCDETFNLKEEHEIRRAKFPAKPKEKLLEHNPIIFNGCILHLKNGNVILTQKGQGKKIQLVKLENNCNKNYIIQRARGAYLASLCQPEAAYDLSIAAQEQTPQKSEITTLNKRLQWQLDNLDRGLTYIPLNLSTAKLFIFVDASFANNKDLSSQIGYEIILANETVKDDDEHEFHLQGNLIHFSSTKCKRVTRSVLASEIYGMVAGIDMGISISSTLDTITAQLNLNKIPVIVCTDSYSLYECLVKLGTTKEKRLMIDIMAIRQSYERRELAEIRWINGLDNPADAMTKTSPNKALENFVTTNKLRIRMEGWVKRGDA